MKMMFVFTCCLIFHLSAEVKAQLVTLKVKDASFTEVTRELKRLTGREFFYNHEEIPAGRAFNLDVKETALDDVLRALLGERFTWEYIDEMVVIHPARPANTPLQQQQRPAGKVTGRVVDEEGAPLVGVTILLKGTTRGVTTDADGNFELPGLDGSSVTLRVTYIGKQPVEIEARVNASRLEIRMKDDTSEIDQVVVTGYQTIAREKSTGAVTTITAATLEDRYTPSLRSNLEGRVAGLTVYGG
ncbi:MAG: carboxypeptidase-like regulatory domain-containing protein, partial [Odoribacteraceae bacterium]|nr:carboxypeptidase-like regulatory domain-containing protein [Odoribacteraceae bacterium]